MLIHVQFELCKYNNAIIHKAVFICNLSAVVILCNYEQTDSYILFLLKYQMFNLTCDSILKYMTHNILPAVLKIAWQ